MSRKCPTETHKFSSTLLGTDVIFSNCGTSSSYCGLTTGQYMVDCDSSHVPPQLRDRGRVTQPEMESGWEFGPILYTMPVAVTDERQKWLRKHAPRPDSIKTINNNGLRVIMDPDHDRFGQFYKICLMVSSLPSNVTNATFSNSFHVGHSDRTPLQVSILR